MNLIAWVPLMAATLHIAEEFVFPGGFPGWYRAYRTEPSRITPRFLFIVNAVLLIACLNIGLLGREPLGIVYWLTISAVLAACMAVALNLGGWDKKSKEQMTNQSDPNSAVRLCLSAPEGRYTETARLWLPFSQP
jgi:hypothetical protein